MNDNIVKATEFVDHSIALRLMARICKPLAVKLIMQRFDLSERAARFAIYYGC